jgi:hypothetical protein
MEHRQAVSRTIDALYFELVGELDYRNLLVIANGMVVGTFLLLSFHFRNALLTLLAALLLFTPANWNSMFWLAAAGSNFAIVFFALATLVLLGRKSETSFVLGLVGSLFCAFSLGNGFLLFPVGLLQLYWQGAGKRQMLLWCGWSLLCIALYFFDYREPQVIQAMFYADGAENAWQLVLQNPLRFVTWTLSVLGCGIGFGNDELSLVAGALLGILFVVAPATGSTRSHPVSTAMVLFLMMSLVLVAQQRFFIAFTKAYFPNRYVYCSLVLVITLAGLCVAMSAGRIQKRLQLSVVADLMAGALTFHLYAIPWGLERGQKMIAPLQKNLVDWINGDNPKIFALFAGDPMPIMNKAIKTGVYDPATALPGIRRANPEVSTIVKAPLNDATREAIDER